MKVAFSHSTALFLLRQWSLDNAIPLRVFHKLRPGGVRHLPTRTLRVSKSLASCARTAREVSQSLADAAKSFPGDGLQELRDRSALNKRLHVLISPRPGTHNSEKVVFHQMAGPLPVASLIELAPGVLCASPELVFVQLAGQLDMGALIALGYELCGCYPVENRPLMVRAPLTTPEQLSAFIRRAEGVRGVRRARMSLKYVHARSASVMESELAALMLTSKKWGGYGLPSAKLNDVVRLSPVASYIARSEHLVVDLHWREYGVALEYDGALAHDGYSRMTRDSRRRDALAAQGIEVSTVTAQQFASINEVEGIVRHIEKVMDRKSLAITAEFREANFALRRQMRNFHNNVGFD